jgi:hypothetical protein
MRRDDQVGIPRATNACFTFILLLTAPVLLLLPGTLLSLFISPV